MRYKDIMVYVDDNEVSDVRIRLAAELAQSHEAHLIGVYVKRALHIPSPAEIEDESGLLAAQLTLSGEFEKKAKIIFEERVNHYSVNSEWRVSGGRVTDALSLLAHYVDLVVLGVNTKVPRNIQTADETLMVAGRPVLAVPYSSAETLVGQRVIVAWDESRESARAVKDSMPILQNADSVRVVTAGRDEKESMADAARICMHLSRHGVTAIPMALAAKREKEVSKGILKQVVDMNADLLVMGAYGHTRLHEVILGGVTDYVMNQMKVPVFLSH